LAGRSPFQLTPKERTEVRNIFHVVSLGGNPYDTPELKSAYPKYKTVFDVFDVCIDVRYGNFIHLPSGNSVLEQPSKTMDCLKYLQSLFRQKIVEEEKKKNSYKKR
jgi:hypothetical protein